MSSIVPSATAQALIKGKDEDSTFTLFPKLPLELRRMVWKFALPGPRMIRILPRSSDKVSRLILQENGAIVLNPEWREMAWSKAASPVILRVNHEARETGLSTYKLAFKGHLSKPIYFDFAQDSLFFSNQQVPESFVWMSDGNSSAVDRENSRVDMGSVRRIVVGVYSKPDILSYYWATYLLLSLVRCFPGLQIMGLAGDGGALKRNGVTTPDAIMGKCKRDWAEHQAREAARARPSHVYADPDFTWTDLGDVEEQCKRGNYGTFFSQLVNFKTDSPEFSLISCRILTHSNTETYTLHSSSLSHAKALGRSFVGFYFFFFFHAVDLTEEIKSALPEAL